MQTAMLLRKIPLRWRLANDSKKADLDYNKILFVYLDIVYPLCNANDRRLFFFVRDPAHLGGLLSGLLCDLGSRSLFGFNGLLLLCGCVAISLLSFFLIKVNWKSAFLFGGALASVRALLEFFFFYFIWGYENIQLIFIQSVLPMLVYTILLMPLFLLLVQKIKEKCDSRWKE